MLSPDTILQDRYQIVRQLGQGGMGAVYEAVDRRFGSTVALKQTLVRGETLQKAFEREARLLNTLQHAALPHVIDYFFEGEGQFLVMQYIPGDDLGQMLRRRAAPFPVEDVLAWSDQLLDLLDYLHTHEPPIVHRDIKPENLKLTKRGNLILLDFGLAKGLAEQAGSAQTTASVLGYTPSYAPLEQIRGTGTDARSDLYAAAATLYHLLTAQLPPDALQRADSHIHGTVDPLRLASDLNPAIPRPVAYALHSALALRRDERPVSATVFRASLRDAARSPATGAPPLPQTHVVQRVAPVTAQAGRPTTPNADQTVLASWPGPPTAPPTYPEAPPAAPANSGTKIAVALSGVALLLLLAGGGTIAYMLWPRPAPSPPPAETPVAQQTPGYAPPLQQPPPQPSQQTEQRPQQQTPSLPLAETSGPVRVTATAPSSRAPIGANRYTAPMAIDGDSGTAWVEGGSGAGIGQSITLTLSRPARVARIRIAPGYFKNSTIWSKNNRLSRATIALDDGRRLPASFEDAMRVQTVAVGGGPVSSITITIEDAYLGGDALDTAISEIVVETE